MKITLEQLEVLRPAIKRIFHGRIEVFDLQRMWKNQTPGKSRWGFFTQKRTLTQEDIIEHLYLAPLNKKTNIQGSLSISGIFLNDKKEKIIKWFMVDIDTYPVKKKARELLLPQLDKDGLDYLLEEGGDFLPDVNDYERWKIWVFGDSAFETAKEYVRQLFYRIGEPIFAGADELLLDKKREFDEIFPINKPDNKGRLFLGPHLKRLLNHETLEVNPDVPVRYPCTFGGETSDDPVVVLKWVAQMRLFTEDSLKSLIKEDLIRPPERDRRSINHVLDDDKRVFRYQSLNLPLPTNNVPPKLRPVIRNCQAVNQVLSGVLEEEYIEGKGQFYHDAGFYLAGLSKYHDLRWESLEGKEFFDWLLDNFRYRPATDHNWYLEDSTGPEEAYKKFPSCAKWEEKFGLCKGCPFQGKIRSPREILNGTPITRKTLGYKTLTTPTEIREKELPKVHAKVLDLLAKEEDGVLVCKHSMGGGKSSLCSSVWIPDLVLNHGKRVLLSVPRADLALEHAERLKAKGIIPFILMSHENIFGHQAQPPKNASLADFDCPDYDEIQLHSKLGVSSLSYKNEFCKNCPFFDTCYYPNQYTQVKEAKYDVVIIQHSHFSCEDVMRDLLDKQFDVLYIDEYFLDNVYKTIEIKSTEISLLEELEDEWSTRLAGWLSCRVKKVIGKINPTFDQLERARKLFQDCGVSWVVPEYITCYNQHKSINPISGIEIIYELPRIPVQVWTDGTAPIRLLKQLTGKNHILIYGDELALDITKIHPENKRFQILDFTASRRSLSNMDLYKEILNKIGEICEYEKNLEKKVLIVVYKDNIDLVKEFLSAAYPNLGKRIERGEVIVSQKSRGINKYADFDMQFTLIGVYLLGQDYQLKTYTFKQVANHYREKKGRELLMNPFPYKRTVNSTVLMNKQPVQRIMKTGQRGIVYSFDEFQLTTPPPGESPENESFWNSCIYENISASDVAQAERIRWTSDKPKESYFLVNVNTGLLITETETLKDFLQS